MRVWDVHPGYLSRGNLLGQHAETHALGSVISGQKEGYRDHPETRRWSEHAEKLKQRHDLTVREMHLRGYRHASPWVSLPAGHSGAAEPGHLDAPAMQFEILRGKYLSRSVTESGRIPLPVSGSDFWAHHKYSVMARSYRFYLEVQKYLNGKKVLPIRREEGLINLVLRLMTEPVNDKALTNVVHHLWGYFKNEATAAERELYINWNPERWPELAYSFYQMALKYDRKYLVHSTVFADLQP